MCRTILPSTIVSHRVPGSGLPARAYPPRLPSLQLRLLVLVLVLVLILLVALLLLALVVGLDAVALHHLELRGDLAQARLVLTLVKSCLTLLNDPVLTLLNFTKLSTPR